jgi:ABC-type glycerol-3-phosphate transport system substrate-binding protein
MKKVFAIIALAAGLTACGGTGSKTEVASDSTAVVADSTSVDSTATTTDSTSVVK